MAELPHFLRSPDPAPAAVQVRLVFTPPGGGELVSVWADRTGSGFVLAIDAPDIAPGWAVSGRGVAGVVATVEGRTIEVSP